MKTFTIAGITWTITDKLMTRMEERGIDELDVKCALKYGKSFKCFEDATAMLTVFEMDKNDYEGQMTNYDTVSTHIVLMHKKNAFGPGREILNVYLRQQFQSPLQYG